MAVVNQSFGTLLGGEAFPDTKYLMRLYQRRVVTDINVLSTAGVGFLDVGKAVVVSG
jgi:hypothetical protein